MNIGVTARADLSGQRTTPGGMVHLLEVCRNLQALGHDVTLFVGSEGRYAGTLPFRVVYVPMIPLRRWDTLSFPFFLLWYLLAWGVVKHCELIYENTIGYSLSGLLAAKLLRVPHAMHVHGFYPDEMAMGGHGAVRVAVVKFFERWNYRFSDALFCVTPVVREKVMATYQVPAARCHFIYNGVDAERCRPMDRTEAARALGLDPEKEYVGFIGYLFPWSGIEQLIAAAPLVASGRPDVRFLVVGHGLWGDRLPGLAREAGVEDRFRFLGYQPWDKIPLLCNVFDVGVTPYVADKGVGRYRSSMKTLEYSAAGCPVVITRAEGVSDIVEQAGCGLVVEPDDPAALAQAILTLLRDPQLRRSMGEKGRRLVEEGYTWRHVAQKMTAVFEKLV
ncbi:MAG: glycosyltransferase family 4 protein [Candidatus Omnitrophica bacterium]|nr:glycosyltransferase family 4 protein [Candidatus Omnitrophota bacterium]